MSSSSTESKALHARRVAITDDSLTVDLVDGRSVSVPLVWYPRLSHGSAAERSNWQLIGRGEGIHWPDLDEDISVSGLLAGHRSAESQASLQRWLGSRHVQTNEARAKRSRKLKSSLKARARAMLAARPLKRHKSR